MVDYAEKHGYLNTPESTVEYLYKKTKDTGCIFRLGHHVVRRFDRNMLEGICKIIGVQHINPQGYFHGGALCVSTLRDLIVRYFRDIQDTERKTA